MKRILAMVIGVLAAAVAGCGGGKGSPLDGTWTVSQSKGGVVVTEAIALNSGGTLTDTVTTPSCAGMVTGSLDWTATLTTITTTGTSTCSGTLTCPGGTLTCTTLPPLLPAGTATYVLSNGNNTLTITTSDGTVVAFARE
jgi:hypothetical protein